MIFSTRTVLTASHDGQAPAAPDTPRTVSGIIIPFHEEGHTSAGPLTAAPGSIELPADPTTIKLYRDHSTVGGTPVGHALSFEETAEGISATFKIARTPDGDAAFSDVTEKVRDALSVELLEHTVTAGRIESAELIAVALVPTPAFAAARIHTTTASHQQEEKMPTQNTTNQGTSNEEKAAAPTTEQPNGTPAAKPSGLTYGDPTSTQPITANAIFESMHRVINGAPADTKITAALQAMTVAKSPFEFAPKWLENLWQGSEYARQYIPHMTQAELTDLKAQGMVWEQKPAVAEYKGHPAEVPSTAPKFKLVEVNATRLAGANTLPIEFVHFGKTGHIAAYFAAMVESYKMLSDQKALTETLAAATTVTAQAQDSLFKKAARLRQAIRKSTRVDPTIYVVNDEDWLNLIDLNEDKIPAFLKQIGADIEQIIPTDEVPAGTVLAWAKPAVTHFELKGSPIRANALDIAHGGTVEGVFGYRALLVNDARGVAKTQVG